MLAATCSDTTVRLWDTTAWTARVLRGHSNFVHEVAFAPDGTWLASAGEDRCVTIWDAQSGDELWTLRGHSAAVTDVRFSDNGIVSASDDGSVRLWRLSF